MADADADEIDGAADTMARAVYIAFTAWFNEGSRWTARATLEADLPALIAHTFEASRASDRYLLEGR